MSENKQSSFLITVTGTAVVLTVGIAAYVFFKGSGDTSTPLGKAKLVPETALMATYINTNAESWNKLQKFGNPKAQQIVSKKLETSLQQILNNDKISYESDIKPWVGGIMIAVLPPEIAKTSQLNVGASSPTNVLLIVGIKDKLSALNFASKLKQQKEIKTEETDYKGQKIIASKTKAGATYTTILDNSNLLISAEKLVVEKAIDTYKGGGSFAGKTGASEILNKGADVENSLAQIYIPDYGNMLAKLGGNSPNKQLPSQVKQFKSLVAGVGVDNLGLRFKATVNLDPQLNKISYENTSGKILGQFPQETFAIVTGKAINKGWQNFVEQSKDSPELNQTIEQVRGQLKLVNLDVDKDIFGWMDGEFGIGAVQSNQGLLANVGFGGALIFDTSDRKTAESTLSKFDDIAKSQRLNVAQKNVDGKEITEWQIPQQGALISHGWLDDKTVFLSLGGPVGETLINRKGQSLDQTENFKTISSALRKPNGGYFYLDMDKMTSVLDKITAQSQSLTPENKAILTSIRGLGITANSPNKSVTNMDMILVLKPKEGK